MTTTSHETPGVVREGSRWFELLLPEMWASLAIAVIWLSVLFGAIFGPNIVSTTPGGSTSVVPSAVVLAIFAFLATWVVARYGFRRDGRGDVERRGPR